MLFGPNYPPVASFSSDPAQGYAPLRVQFSAQESYDPDGWIVSYSWDFGDGGSGEGLTAAHTYNESGTYTVILRVLDDRGGNDLATRDVVIVEVPQGYLVRHYEWEWEKEQYWDVLLYQGLYEQYHQRVRQPFIDNYKYDDYVLDPLDDPTLEDLAHALLNRVGGDEEAFLECALAFVQGAIEYAKDPGAFEYPFYPMETLVEGKGDCEDTTILYVGLLKGLGHSASMAFVDTDHDDLPDHVVALVPVRPAYAATLTCSSGMTKGVWEIQSQSYVLAETAIDPDTSGYIPLGCDPWGLSEEDFKQIWSF
jgi:PKD repeat protein